MARQHTLARLGLIAGVAGGIFILGACSRPGGGTDPTATAAVTVRSSPSVARTATRTTTAPTATTATTAPSAPPAAAPSQPPAPPAATATTPAATTAGQKYVVQPDDTLSGIAEMFGVTVQELIDTNKLENPNLLLPGQELIIPGR